MAKKKQTKKVEAPVVEAPVVETPKPKKDTWEIKDRTYYLKEIKDQFHILLNLQGFIGLMKS